MATLESIRSIAERFMKKFEGTPMELKSPIDYELHYRYPPEDGWIAWEEDQPVFECSDCMIEVIRAGWDKPKFAMVGPLRVDPNTAGRYWRKSGIYKQREEDERVRQIADRLLGKNANPWDVSGMAGAGVALSGASVASMHQAFAQAISGAGAVTGVSITSSGAGYKSNIDSPWGVTGRLPRW